MMTGMHGNGSVVKIIVKNGVLMTKVTQFIVDFRSKICFLNDAYYEQKILEQE